MSKFFISYLLADGLKFKKSAKSMVVTISILLLVVSLAPIMGEVGYFFGKNNEFKFGVMGVLLVYAILNAIFCFSHVLRVMTEESLNLQAKPSKTESKKTEEKKATNSTDDHSDFEIIPTSSYAGPSSAKIKTSPKITIAKLPEVKVPTINTTSVITETTQTVEESISANTHEIKVTIQETTEVVTQETISEQRQNSGMSDEKKAIIENNRRMLKEIERINSINVEGAPVLSQEDIDRLATHSIEPPLEEMQYEGSLSFTPDITDVVEVEISQTVDTSFNEQEESEGGFEDTEDFMFGKKEKKSKGKFLYEDSDDDLGAG